MTRATSIAAKVAIAPVAPTLRRQVLCFISRCGTDGATLAEIEAALGMSGNTVRPRRIELQEKGLVIDSGRRRPTPSARQAIVWVVPERVRDVLRKRGEI